MLGEMGGYAWRELRRRKWRTATTVLGYFLAVGVTVGLIAAMSSRQAADRVLSSTGTHFVAFCPADAGSSTAASLDCIDPDHERLIAVGNNEIPTRLFSPELLPAVQKIPTVKDASGAVLFRFKDAGDGHGFTVAGVDVGNNEAVGTTCCAATDVLRGYFLNPKDKHGAMVEEAYAKAHHLDVNQKVTVAGTPFTVVGIINSGIRPTKADIYIAYPDAEQAINSRVKGEPLQHRFNALLVEVLNANVQNDAMKEVKALDSNLVVSTYACYRPAAQVMGMNETAIRILVVLVALGVVMFAAKTQFASVVERRRDIGVLKAVGWSSREVGTLLLAESIIQGLIGGLLGGIAAIIGLTISEAGTPTASPTSTAEDLLLIGGILGVGMLLAVVGGVLAGAIPAFLAVKINPAEAIRKL